MAIESFLKPSKEDPDWFYSPEQYLGKQFKVIDANCLQINHNEEDVMVLRLTPTEPELLCKNLQIVCRENSKLDLYIICDGDVNLQQVFLYSVKLLENSILNVGIFTKDGKLNKHMFEVDIEENSNFNLFGLCKNTVGGSTEIISKVYHSNKGAESDHLLFCLAGENSRTVYQGTVKIDRDMIDSYTNINSSNLIIGKNGQCFVQPQLMIDCGEANATHSLDIGNIDDEALYYLKSRGLSEEEARAHIIDSFQNQILDIVPELDLRDELKDFFQD